MALLHESERMAVTAVAIVTRESLVQAETTDLALGELATGGVPIAA